ncbi:hypothetical protein [Veronia pacifica]|nr:hypothetical protein [Veronia pacifica]
MLKSLFIAYNKSLSDSLQQKFRDDFEKTDSVMVKAIFAYF